MTSSSPDGMRDVMQKGGYVEFLKVDTKRRIVSEVFEFSVSLRGDRRQVGHVNYGSFRVHYIL